MSEKVPLQQPASGPASMTPNRPKLQPSYAHQIQLNDSDHNGYEMMLNCLGSIIGCFGSIPLPCFCCCPNPYRTVGQGSVGLISRFGKYYRAVDPGLYQINIMSEAIKSVDIRIQVEDIPRQFIMTKDNCNVSIDSVLYWHITDPYTATYLVSDVRKALIERTQTTLRHILGTRALQDCIENRETIALHIQEIIAEPAKAWGIRVESILIKDLQFSQELQDTLSAAAKQKRVAESKVIEAEGQVAAKIIAAEGEVKAAELNRKAADILNTTTAMQLRYLDTMRTMAATANTKVIFMPGNSSGADEKLEKGKGKDQHQ